MAAPEYIKFQFLTDILDKKSGCQTFPDTPFWCSQKHNISTFIGKVMDINIFEDQDKFISDRVRLTDPSNTLQLLWTARLVEYMITSFQSSAMHVFSAFTSIPAFVSHYMHPSSEIGFFITLFKRNGLLFQLLIW